MRLHSFLPVVTLSAYALLGGTGCSASPASGGDETVQDGTSSVSASAVTTQTYGITRWTVAAEDLRHVVVEGLDADGNERMHLESTIVDEADGTRSATLSSVLPKAATMHFSWIPGGKPTIDRNDFTNEPQLVDEVSKAIADFNDQHDGNGLTTAGFVLRAGQGLTPQTGLVTKCVILLTAGVVALAPITGGPGSAEVVASTVDAGTSKCE